MNELERIADQLDRAVSGNAWHGPALLELLSDVTPHQAASRALPGVHTIWEIVSHVTVWKDEVRKRLMEGGPVRDVPAEKDWPHHGGGPAAWFDAISRLRKAQAQLRESLHSMAPGDLEIQIPGYRYSHYQLLHGVIQHDLYHAGQIAILKKITPRQPAPNSEEGKSE